jgi:SAM-dependent methyltransferase
MATIQVSLVVALAPRRVFDLLVTELETALGRQGLHFEAGPDGWVREGTADVATVTAWKRGKGPGFGLTLKWNAPPWKPARPTALAFRVQRAKGGTRVTVTHESWGGEVGKPRELVGWFADQVAAPLLRAMAPAALGDWITDRRARRPAGADSRAIYADPVFHYPNFRVILDELALTARDHLVEVACGGGALLKRALASGCRAAAIDHSAEMVGLALEANRDAVAQGRLEIRQSDASALPWPDATFTCAAMTGVLGFLSDPVRTLSEIRRVLRPGGRLVALGTDPEMKGTPAAPEPIASRLAFYDSAALEALGRAAGFEEVRVVRRDLEPFAREEGVPEFALPLFAAGTDGGARFLLARRR